MQLEQEPFLGKRKSLMKSLEAYEMVRDKILTGEKLPGTRLVLSELETELAIGRGPIREALMRLDRSGLIKNIPYRGAIVATPPKRKEIEHIYDIRVDLEIKLALEAMKNLKKTDFSRLNRLNTEMQKCADNYYALDREFHDTIYEASNLPHLCDMIQKLILPVEVFLNINRQEVEDCQVFNNEHQLIIDSLKDKDADRLKSSLSTNIKSGLTVIERTLDRTIRFNS
jgi:DNA-binding GntR family transcriptional regulator